MSEIALVRLGPEHAEAMFRWMRDPAVAENLMLRNEPTLEKTRSFIERAATDDTMAARAILVDGAHVGNVVLDCIDRFVGKARLHVYVGEPSARDKGVGKRAVRQALGLAFGALALEKVYLTVHARNARAIAAYTAVGFREEGVHRGEFLLGGTRLDEIYMGVLRSETEAG